MTKRFSFFLVALLLVLGISVTLVGCKPKEKAAQGITADSIIIGNTAATSGVFAGVGVPFNLAMEVVFDQYNASRAEGERKIVFKHYDDEFNGEKGLAFTRKLVEEDKVFALVGHFGTNTVEATMDYLLESGVPMVYGVTGVNSLYFAQEKGNNILSVQPIYRTEGQILVARALNEALFGAQQNAKLGATAKIVVLYSNDDAGNSMKLGVEDEVNAKGIGTRVVYLPFEAATAAAVVTTALSHNPGVILLAANQAPATAAATALRQNNSQVPVLTSYVNSATVFTPAREQVESKDGDGNVIKDANGNPVMVPVNLPYNVYANAWVDIVDATAPAPTADQVGGDGTLAGFAFPLSYLPGYTAEYWEFVKLMNDSTRVSGETSAKALWANPYAMAGYVAAKTFVALLEKVEDFDHLSWKEFIKIAESAPIKLPLAGTIDWRDGKRHGLASLALTKLSYSPTVSFVKVLPIESKEDIYK